MVKNKIKIKYFIPHRCGIFILIDVGEVLLYNENKNNI